MAAPAMAVIKTQSAIALNEQIQGQYDDWNRCNVSAFDNLSDNRITDVINVRCLICHGGQHPHFETRCQVFLGKGFSK